MILKESKTQAQPVENYTLNRLINYTKTAEGPIVPNRLQGGNERVYTVSGLRVVKTERVGANTNFTLVWSQPTEQQADQLSFYQVFVLDQNAGITQPLSTTLARSSPAIVSIAAPEGSVFTFLVQTMLKNGQVSDIMASPTCTGRSLDTTNNLYNLQSPITVANTTTTTTLYTRSLAGNTIGQGQNFRLSAIGFYSTANGTDQFLIECSAGGFSALNATSVAAAVSNVPVLIDFTGTFYTNGLNSGSARTALTTTLNATTTTTVETSTTSSIDTTQPMDFVITIQWSNALAGNTLTLNSAQFSLY